MGGSKTRFPRPISSGHAPAIRRPPIAPIRRGDGEHCITALMFQASLLQAQAIDFCHIDSWPARGTEREVSRPVLLWAAEVSAAGVPAAGRGPGLCEYVQHISHLSTTFCVSASL